MAVNKNVPVLSICIPTFQRKNALEQTLHGLVESENLAAGKLEICISDNGSTDGTFEMLKRYEKKYKFIHIRKNPKNLGFDSNLLSSLKMARGRYCWGIGDDDTVVPENIQKFVRLLDKKSSFMVGITGAMAKQKDLDMIIRKFPKQEYSSKEFIDIFISVINSSSRFIKSNQDIPILGFFPCYFFSNGLLKHSFRALEGKRYGWYHLALFFYGLSNFEGSILVNKEPPILHGQSIEHKKDNVLLPGDEFILFVDRRADTLSGLNLDSKLRESFYRWLNIRGNYVYVKSLVQLVLLSQMLGKSDYDTLKNKVYGCERRLKMPFWIYLAVLVFKTMEKSSIFRKILAILYSKLHSAYARQIDGYLKGQLHSNDDREGKSSFLKSKNSGKK
ncbi:MAG: glycosyltransferase family 2 protein [Candidatus Nanoarchaeia archaeon]|nr:glycosyltransferase family 2 protein [Candidatus Nanoarchaeia archaeon]MDD5239275.1 glycosyltransferase family 2 protein [Candidatus Nanoarchaeia archaeon]